MSNQPLHVYSQSNGDDCDTEGNKCAYYVAVSESTRHIIIVFRGTKGTKQLFHETLQSLQPNVDFYGHGKVSFCWGTNKNIYLTFFSWLIISRKNIL